MSDELRASREKEIKGFLGEWRKEYDNVARDKKIKNLFTGFSDVIQRMNFFQGNMKSYFNKGHRIDDPVDQKVLTYCLVNELIETSKENKWSHELTRKGDFFAKKYAQDGNLREFKAKESEIPALSPVLTADHLPF